MRMGPSKSHLFIAILLLSFELSMDKMSVSSWDIFLKSKVLVTEVSKLASHNFPWGRAQNIFVSLLLSIVVKSLLDRTILKISLGVAEGMTESYAAFLQKQAPLSSFRMCSPICLYVPFSESHKYVDFLVETRK